MGMRETFELLCAAEKPAQSRFAIGSPCCFVRSIDILIHIIVPELIENKFSRTARYLRSTSPRWGQSWRYW
jgi:hypothetical protein